MVLDIVGKREVPEFLSAFLSNPSVYGSFNESPSNWREIEEKELVQNTLWLTYTPVAVDYKQVIAPLGEYAQWCKEGKTSKVPSLAVSLFIYHDGSGIGIHRDYWAGKMRYFRFDFCHHEMVTDEKRMCWWAGHCSKCGWKNAIDSSD